VCARSCDPVSATSPRSPLLACPAGFGCDLDTTKLGVSYCSKRTGAAATHATCALNTDCVAGNYCSSTTKVCTKYCYTSMDCATGSTCQLFSPAYYAGSRPMGACSP